MVVFKASLLRNVKEMKIFDLEISKTNNSYQKATVKALDADIKKIEKQLEVYISEDSNLEKIFELEPGVDAQQIQLMFEGLEYLS